ncbi:hypothetical protein BDR06DRAFT_68362 [Suillus hirtellus]|nr:hypothetical protein BDR06DRAFT_68362 [Suillus hirtellus]
MPAHVHPHVPIWSLHPKRMAWVLETAYVGCLVLTSLLMRPSSSSVAPLHFQIFTIGIVFIWDDKRKEVLVVLAFEFIVHTLPILEYFSPFLCREIRSMIGPRLDLYLPRLHPRTIRPSVIYFNAQDRYI